MNSTVETTAAQAAAAAAAAKGKETEVDGEAFGNELAAQLAATQGAGAGKLSAADKITNTMERLAQALSGLTVSRGTTPSLGDSPGYFLRSGETSQVTISNEMLLQMADDEAMFSKVKDMVGGLFSAGISQPLNSVPGSTVSWQHVSIDVQETRYVETYRDSGNRTTALSSLTMATQDIIKNALDLLLDTHQTSRGSGSGGSRQSGNGKFNLFKNQGSVQSWGFGGMVTNTTNWRLESVYTSANQAMESLKASQSMVSRLEIMIEEIEISGGSSGGSLFGYMQAMGLTDPLVFDLGGEGINLTSAEDGVYFDIKGDGSPVRTAWITGNNAFLYLDGNGNGVVDDANELFGDHGGHANGFEKLAQYDSNGDGVIDSSDEIYSSLRLWRDLNGDGVNQGEESLTLEEAGIASISLGYDDRRELDGFGNVIGERSYFTRVDGSRGEVADAWLRSLKG